MEIGGLTENVDVIEEPVEKVEAPGDDIGDFEEVLCVARMDDLDAFELKKGLEDAEKLTGLSHTL